MVSYIKKKLQSNEDFKLLSIIEKSPQVSQREIAKKVGLSLGKVNYCLKSLGKKGLIKIKRFSKSDHKIKYVYLLTPEGIKKKSMMTLDFLEQKLEEYEALQDEITTLKRELK
jgi:EPS-associated MarR family transcriptional regulator